MVVPQKGTPLSWEETKKYADHVREGGIRQFIRIYHKVKDRSCKTFKWGDEIEYILVRLEHEDRRAFLLLNNIDVIALVTKFAAEKPGFCGEYGSHWVTELPAHLVESTPGIPFGCDVKSLTTVESNMELRRKQMGEVLHSQSNKQDVCLTMTFFPRNGCQCARIPRHLVNSPTSVLQDLVIPPDELICPFPRFRSVMANPERRRGEKTAIRVPVFEDIKTNSCDMPMSGADKARHILLDLPVLGVGVTALQVTVQGSSLLEAKYIHDQFVPLCPIMMTVSAAAPITKGFLTNWDCRWGSLSPAVDCRTEEERGLKPLKNQRFRIPKSRIGTVSGYLFPPNAKLNDLYFPYNEELCKHFINEGMDVLFARHMARQFIRDPLYILKERLHQKDNESEHFENIIGTNWQSVRFKIPPEDSDIGWRVEFRTMDTQITSFENAAYVVFMVLLTRAVIELKLDFAMPISKVDENMEIAKLRNAVKEQAFYFRLHPYQNEDETVLCKMDVNTVINGGITPEGADFIGIIPIINRYIESIGSITKEEKTTLDSYLKLISDRASGRVMTTAQWMRNFVDKHQGYKHDSVISAEISYDLIKICSDISNGHIPPEHLSQVEV